MLPTAAPVTAAPTPTGSEPPATVSALPTATPIAADQVTIRAVSAASGEGLPAVIFVGDVEAGQCDEQGYLRISRGDAQALVLSASANQHHLVTVMGTLSGDVILPLRPQAAPGSFGGEVDLSQMQALSPGQLRLGLVTRSFEESPVALDFAAFLSDFRSINLCDVELALPANFVAAVPNCAPVPGYEVTGPGGQYDAFALVGDLPLAQTASLLTGPAAFQNLGQLFLSLDAHLASFSWDVVSEVSVIGGESTGGVDPAVAGLTNAAIAVSQGPAPDGVGGDEPALLFLLVDMGEAYLPIGIAGGSGAAEVHHPPLEGHLGGRSLLAMAMAGKGGVGSGQAYSSVMAQVESGETTAFLPAYLELVETGVPHKASRSFAFTAVDGVDLYLSVFTFPDGSPQTQWDVYHAYSADASAPLSLPAGGAMATVVLPNLPLAPELTDIDWQLSAYDMPTNAFEALVSGSGNIHLADVEKRAHRMSRDEAVHLFR